MEHIKSKIITADAKKRSRIEGAIAAISNLHYTQWYIVDDVADEIKRLFPEEKEVYQSLHQLAVGMYHKEEYYAGLL